MSIRLIDEIYSALHKGEKPPYTSRRTVTINTIDLGKMLEGIYGGAFIPYEDFKFKNFFGPPIIEPPKYLPPIID